MVLISKEQNIDYSDLVVVSLKKMTEKQAIRLTLEDSKSLYTSSKILSKK